MQFTDFTFLFLFLPAFSIIFFLIPKQFKAVWILVGSSIFYFWAEPLYFWVLLFLVVINYIFAVLIRKTCPNQYLSKTVLALIILVDLGLMVLLRDASLVSRVLNIETSSSEIIDRLFFPIGISFILSPGCCQRSLTRSGGPFSIRKFHSLLPKNSTRPHSGLFWIPKKYFGNKHLHVQFTRWYCTLYSWIGQESPDRGQFGSDC
jgi:hypothetical protein